MMVCSIPDGNNLHGATKRRHDVKTYRWKTKADKKHIMVRGVRHKREIHLYRNNRESTTFFWESDHRKLI